MFFGVDDLDVSLLVLGKSVMGVRVQFRSRWFVAVQIPVLNWNLTPITSLTPITFSLAHRMPAQAQRLVVLAQGLASV